MRSVRLKYDREGCVIDIIVDDRGRSVTIRKTLVDEGNVVFQAKFTRDEWEHIQRWSPDNMCSVEFPNIEVSADPVNARMVERTNKYAFISGA